MLKPGGTGAEPLRRARRAGLGRGLCPGIDLGAGDDADREHRVAGVLVPRAADDLRRPAVAARTGCRSAPSTGPGWHCWACLARSASTSSPRRSGTRPPQSIAPFEYTAMLWAVAIDWVFWDAWPGQPHLAGRRAGDRLRAVPDLAGAAAAPRGGGGRRGGHAGTLTENNRELAGMVAFSSRRGHRPGAPGRDSW